MRDTDGAISSHMLSHKSRRRIPRQCSCGSWHRHLQGTSSCTTKSSQFPVTGEFTNHEAPSGVVISTEDVKDRSCELSLARLRGQNRACAPLLSKKRPISIDWTREKVENRIALRSSVIPSRQIHHQPAVGALCQSCFPQSSSNESLAPQSGSCSHRFERLRKPHTKGVRRAPLQVVSFASSYSYLFFGGFRWFCMSHKPPCGQEQEPVPHVHAAPNQHQRSNGCCQR